MAAHDPNVPEPTGTWADPNPNLPPQPVEPLPARAVGDTQPDHRSDPAPDDTVSHVALPASEGASPGTLPAPDAVANPDGGTLPQSPEDAGKAAQLSQEVPIRPTPTVPGYQLLGELGRGGMGVVYRARQIRLNRPTAIKMLLGGQFSDTVAQVRFLIEAEVIAQIQHPNVVQVFEFGQADGQPYFALEFVDGGTLAGKLQSAGRFAPRDAAEMVAKLADGIAAAHAKGIVHRDLKPTNVLIDEHGEPKVTDFGLAKVGSSEMTVSGAIMGTPSYMSPEQAAGKTKDIGTTTDIYSLGVILYELLAGCQPFKGDSVMETIQQVLTREPAKPRAVVPSIPRDLETICLECMAKEPHKRYATAEALVADLRAFLDGRPIAARPVGTLERAWKWAKRHPGRAAAIVAEVLVMVCVSLAANQVQRQREADRIAADEATRHKQRETRAESLVRALSTANTPEVPRVIDELAEVRELAGSKLAELAAQPISTKPGLHGRLCLLAEEPGRAAELAAYLPVCEPDELLTIRQLLKPHAASVAPAMWATLYDEQTAAGKRVRAACALAEWNFDDQRWPLVAHPLSDAVVRATPGEFVVWSQALEPVRGYLVPALVKRYPQSRAKCESGKLVLSDLVAEASGFDLTANLLGRYTADQPAELAELAMTVDARHHTQFAEAIRRNRDTTIAVLKSELRRSPLPVWAQNDEIGPAMAAVVGVVGCADILNPDPVFDALAKRQANAAAVLLTLGEADSVWPLFAFPKNGDPSVRSYLLERLAAIGADPMTLVQRFETEPDVSARRALLIALGDFPPELVPVAEREPFVSRLLVLYRSDPDSGLHGAIDWLLRQRWGKAKDLAPIDADLTKSAQGRADRQKDWYVNSEGQTYAVVRGPVEFALGSPLTEPGRSMSEPPHRKQISRAYAISTKEVTVEQYLRFRPNHSWTKRYSPDPDSPIVTVTWYDCAEYCNWLSEREGIPRDQWCYEPNKDGKYAERMSMKLGHLALTGYRLPTEPEWEYACRSGSVTSRYYGRGESLLPRYGWFAKTADDRAWPVGQLRPNDRGLFDALGNALEWVEAPWFNYTTSQREDIEDTKYITINEQSDRLLRGGSFFFHPLDLRSAFRFFSQPGNRYISGGFRPSRTLLN
ncbi:MAG: SUMF1/EgtB/PvdO family nonheme iron enzyme [Planctomycetes bacterium]|nr:SUMF1/EgtB/PvdO family nonheme iron enzyme [Planctomycetota bacterium]